MKKNWLFFGSFFLLFIIGALWLFNAYQKPRESVGLNQKADFFLTAEGPYNEFITNESNSNQKYLGKLLEVTGKVYSAEVIDSAAMVVITSGEHTSGINCSLLNTYGHLPEKEKTITVKGRCTGFLMDVTLVDAVIVKQ